MVISPEQGSKIAKLKAQESIESEQEESLRDRYRKSDYFRPCRRIQLK